MTSYPISRRNFLKGSLTGSALAVVAGVGLLRPGTTAAAAWPKAAFRAQTESEAIKALFGSVGAEPDEAIKIRAPLVISNGETLPIAVWTDMKNVERIAIVADTSSNPLCSSVSTAGAVGYYSTHIKLPKSSRVTAYVKARGKLYSQSVRVKITHAGYAFD